MTAPTGRSSILTRFTRPAPATAPGAPTRWSDDAFLDSLRQLGDAEADACARRVKAERVSTAAVRDVFARMPRNDSPLPADAPAPLREFFGGTHQWCDRCRQPALPAWVDRDRLLRGQEVFMTRMMPCVLVLLAKSLPEGYAALGATQILNISGELVTHTYHRLMGTLQLLIDVAKEGSFERAGNALVAAQMMRLLHAGVRTNVVPVVYGPERYAAYRARFGVPVNQEDLLATIMAFSLLVVRGLQRLRVPLHSREAEDYWYVWRVFAHLMGIHPPGEQENDCHLPVDLAEAQEFYDAYCRRHYAGATSWSEPDWQARSERENPDGTKLVAAHVRMLSNVAGPTGRFLDMNALARIYIQDLVGEAGCARVALPKVEGAGLLRLLFLRLPRLWSRLWRRVDGGIHERVSQWFLQHLVAGSYAHGIVFTLPTELEDLRELVRRDAVKRGSMAVERV